MRFESFERRVLDICEHHKVSKQLMQSPYKKSAIKRRKMRDDAIKELYAELVGDKADEHTDKGRTSN